MAIAAMILLVLASLVLAYLTYMDLRYFLLPNRGNLALAILGAASRALETDWSDDASITMMLLSCVVGAAVGAGIFLFTRFVSLKWKKVEGIGWGDVKFAAAAGIWLGPGNVGLMVGVAAALLLVFGGLVVLITKRPLRDFYLPFGAAAAPATLFMIWALHFDWIAL